MIEAKGIIKTFVSGEIKTRVLRGIDLTVSKGEYVAIMGRSGAGKSTLLYQMSLLDTPTDGDIIIEGTKTVSMTEKQRTAFRLTNLGYIFQEYALLPELTAVENVMVPLLMLGLRKGAARKKAEEALSAVGLGHRFGNCPGQLSGGEQQRVSIARAVAHEPRIIFADEPTANLDSETAETVMDLLDDLHKQGQTIIMITHEREYGERAERIVQLNDGVVISDKQLRKSKKKKT